MSKKIAIIFSGFLWMVIGVMLLSKGLRLIVGEAALSQDKQQTALLLISIGLLIGFIKGRFILSKTVKRVVERILSLPLPLPLAKIYDRKYLILLASMMTLGMTLKFLPISANVLGTIDVVIGSALINGALIYLRYTIALKTKA